MEIDSQLIKALSVETRKTILKTLGSGERNLSDISRRLGKDKSTVLEHMRVLERSGLVRREGAPGKKWVFYSLTGKGRK